MDHQQAAVEAGSRSDTSRHQRSRARANRLCERRNDWQNVRQSSCTAPGLKHSPKHPLAGKRIPRDHGLSRHCSNSLHSHRPSYCSEQDGTPDDSHRNIARTKRVGLDQHLSMHGVVRSSGACSSPVRGKHTAAPVLLRPPIMHTSCPGITLYIGRPPPEHLTPKRPHPPSCAKTWRALASASLPCTFKYPSDARVMPFGNYSQCVQCVQSTLKLSCSLS